MERHFPGEDGGAGAVADAELEFPFDGPFLLLLVLAAFDEDGVGAFSQVALEFVLIHPLAAMVLVAAEEELAVDPDFPGVFAAEADFGGAVGR